MIQALAKAARTAFGRSTLPTIRPPLPLAPQLCLEGVSLPANDPKTGNASLLDILDSVWFAVPKKRVTRGKKRQKTMNQKAIKKNSNIVIDKRTGELTLSHHLPFNWKDYLPDSK
uniref:Uncharacterized protein n=1 Tax=Trieres chinensis TaxID=1514140 RepID=A0A7S2EJ99_TRICV|mmetsp:Transcript_26222/g.53743  ORF Transcript_26222/g.53743 Transcript_26222/m.53743 type:complete len:115 (+) Transcript_26222:99-443(+)